MNYTPERLKQARDSGYSDDDIWGFLSQQDDRFGKAKEAGYSLDEVSSFFSERQTPQEPTTLTQPEPSVGTSFMEEVSSIPQAFRQAVDQPLEAIGETAEVLGSPSVGEALRGAIDSPEGYVPASQRFMEPQEGEFQIGGFAPQFLPRAIVEQAGQIVGSIATRAAGSAIGGLAGSALGPKGTVAGTVAGAFLGPALFEMSQIVGPVARERAANQGREEPTNDDLAWAWATAGASGALNAIGAKYLPNGDKLVGGLASKVAAAVAGEGTTEGLQSVVQQTGQTFLTEQGLEIKPKEAIGEALIGGGAGGASVVAAAPFTPPPEAKAKSAANTKIAAERAASVAPETAQVVSEQANQVIAEAQAEETAETPDERVARLQREAQEAAGDIELEEEPPVSGLPPERIKSARWFESAARNRLKELQDKDDAGMEDFTTQETEEFEFLKSNPTPEQIAERYGYGVAPAVEPTAVTTTPPTTPAATEPEPTLTPPPAATEPTGAAIVEDADPNNPPVNSMGQLVRFKAPARKGSLVTDGDGRRGDVVSEDGTKLTVEWRDGTTSTVDESEVKRSVQRDMKARNAVAVEESRVGNYTIVGVFFTDTQGVSRKIFERQIADTQSDTDYTQAVKEATDRASQYALENNLAGYGTKEGDFISQPKTPTPTTPTAEVPATPAVTPVEPVVPLEGAVEPAVTEVAPEAAISDETYNNRAVQITVRSSPSDWKTQAIESLVEDGSTQEDASAQVEGWSNDTTLNFLTDRWKTYWKENPDEFASEYENYFGTQPPVQPTPVTPTPVTPEVPTAVEGTGAAFNEFIREELQRQVDEQRGQQVLDTMEQAGESPRAVVENFYRNIYDNLTPDVRARFDKYVERLGWSVPATMDSSPKSIGLEGAIDLGNDVQALEGIERGFVALARTANDLYAQRPEVAPTPELAAPTAAEPPALAPLRRVVKAEQTEEDVSGLVGQGLVEPYKGQPVITQAGLETLPEAERPRLTPEAKTLSNLKASMEKVDAASEAKGGKPETQKVSEIAANWMDSGGDERALQDAITENTNLSPANAAKVARVIAKQYGLQQQIAETGAVVADITPEPEGTPRKSSVTKLIEATTGVRKPIVKLQVSETAGLKKQIQLKAREARETRKARKEAAEELAKSITDYIKANPIRGPINSRQAMSITKKALKLDVNNEAAVDRFEMYVERVIENANYDRDLADARALIKRAKTFAKAKDTQGNVKTTLEAIANVAPNLLDNPFEFNLVVQRYLLGLAPVTAKQYAVMPDADVRRYLESLETQIKANQEVLDRAKAQRILDKQAAYATEKGIPLDEAIAILNSEEFLEEKTIEKLEDLTKLLTSMAQESQKDVKAYDETGATPKQKELISFMRRVSLDSLTNEEKKRYIRFSNNLLANGATFGMEQFQSIALGQEAAIKAVKDKRLSNKLAAWISPIGGDKAIDTARRIALRTQSEADTFKNIFGREAVGAFRNILGLNRLDVAQTDSNRAKEKIANEFGEYFKGLRKKYGDDATGFEAKGYAGIAGYLIQTDGIKTEAESIPYRRRLMEQNIAELRKSDRQTDLAEADLKERALAQLTGTTNAEILSQLRALNPASYEQLMWVKDVMLPKWRDFLKEHDENFRNQANNYNNPDHLTITYKFPEGQLLPNEIEDVYQQDAIGMRIKQAANSIKRKDHPNLPVSPRTGTVANIDINFGYNQYNALVDQVDKAFVAPAWEQVVSFTKAPEFEQIMGGRANSLFVKKLLTDIQTSRTRQSMTDDEAQMVAGGVRLARKISTQAVLGGITQPLRQIPDQLTKLFFTTGRVDLITKNLLATAEAAPLLNKFPIGRRGDAQAGTQYASQFSELARKVEASVTDRKWAQYRELMNRVGEFWMAPLRGSDVWAAKVSWMSYYEAELNKKGIKMESWEREAELVDTDQDRKEAASYAEFAVDFYGGASDPTKMASLSKQTNNGWKEFAKLVFLPLNSFALQQKNSLISDLRDAYLRTGDRKASIAAIAGTLAGMAAFHGMRIYIIGGLVYPAGKALLMGLFGIDMEEPDEEEKQKKLEDDWRKFKASMYGNIIAGGAGEFAEKAAIDAVNRATYLIQANVNPDELLNDKGEVMSFRQYEKDVSPLYRFRSFGSSEYSFGLADVLTEQAQRSLTETQQIMTDEEMERYTGNEQAYAMFSTMVEWLYFFRLMDTDVTRIARDLKRQMDKGVEEREKEIKAIRSGR